MCIYIHFQRTIIQVRRTKHLRKILNGCLQGVNNHLYVHGRILDDSFGREFHFQRKLVLLKFFGKIRPPRFSCNNKSPITSLHKISLIKIWTVRYSWTLSSDSFQKNVIFSIEGNHKQMQL